MATYRNKTKSLVKQLIRCVEDGEDRVSLDALSDWHDDHAPGSNGTIRDLLEMIRDEEKIARDAKARLKAERWKQ